MDALVARVLPDVAGFERELDYAVPAEMAHELRPGSVVRVPLKGRKVRGWVLAFPVEPATGVTLKPVAKVSGWGPEPELLELASWAARRWAGRRRSLLVTASPVHAVRALPVPAQRGASVPSQTGPAQTGPAQTGAAQTGAAQTGAAQTGAAQTGAAQTGAGLGRVRPSVLPSAGVGAGLLAQGWRAGTQLLRLPPAASATDLVVAAAQRGPVLVLAPTEARAEAGSAALRSRGAGVALLPGEWAQARAGARVVIGSRGAAWGPCPGMESAVVLDAHDSGYVQGTSPTWAAPDVVAERARLAGVPCFWVSPCPTLEMLAASSHVWLPSRSEERSGWAGAQVVDRRPDDPRSGLFSHQLVAALRNPASRVLCVLNRKGRATLLDCAACGELATCERCGSSLASVAAEARASSPRQTPARAEETRAEEARAEEARAEERRAEERRAEERRAEELVCRHCGERRPAVCAACGSIALRARRLGVAGVRGQLEALAGRPVADVSTGTGPFPTAPVVVGTEGVLYRETEVHRAGGASLVAFLDFDQELLAPRYRAGEEALALLARASRLVGGRAGTVLVQTRVPGHPVLKAALLADPGRLSAAEEPVRKELRLPPFAALALLSGPGASELASALRSARQGGAEVELSQVREDRWVVRARDHEALAAALGSVARPRERVRVEVGPPRI